MSYQRHSDKQTIPAIKIVKPSQANHIPQISIMPLDTSEMDKFVGKKLFPNKDDQRNTVNVNELPGFYRVVRPGMMVTRDFHENRYNFHTDDSGTITRVSRG